MAIRSKRRQTEPSNVGLPRQSKKRVKIDEDGNLEHAVQFAQDSKARLRVNELRGDFFAAEPHSVLVHACNCQGSWGAGIAAAFKASYPAAYNIYAEHCHRNERLLGTCLLIPPQVESESTTERERLHWIACLFTSVGKGRTKGSKKSILEATDTAMRDLLKALRSQKAAGAIRMCKINSGLFRVEWSRTKQVLEAIELDTEDIQSVDVFSKD